MKFFLGAIMITCLLTFGCSQQQNSQKVLRLAFATEVASADPRHGYALPACYVVKMLFEGLMGESFDGEFIPAACESYTISEDQKTYTFIIRSAQWSNGKPVTAYDFEYEWKSVIDPLTKAEGGKDFYPIKNVERIIKGELPLDTVGIRAIDAKTLVVELENPTPYFLELTATAPFCPVHVDLDHQDPHWSEKTSPQFVSNGPFLLKERVFNSHLVLEKNPLYWNADQVSLEKIHISIVPDVQTQHAMFEKQQIDWFGRPFCKLPLDALPSLKEKGNLQFLPINGRYWYFLNTEKFPFNHKKIRQAFSFAIDRQAIVNHVLQQNEAPATSLTRDHSFFSDGNIAKAKQLFSEALEELELTDQQFPPITLSFPAEQTNYRVSSVVQQQWQNVFGIEVILDPQEWTSYYSNLVNGNYLVGEMGWIPGIRDPLFLLSMFKYKQITVNMSFWEHPEFQKLLNEAEQETDPGVRKALLTQAEALFVEEMPLIPLYFVNSAYLKNDVLKNVYLSEDGHVDFTRAYKKSI